MANFLERLRIGKRFSGGRWACLQFKDKVVEQKFQHSFIQNSHVFVRIVKATTILMAIVVVVNRLTQQGQRYKNFNELNSQIVHSGIKPEYLVQIETAFDEYTKLNLIVVMFTVFWTIWSVICFIFAQIRFRPFMHSQDHPKFQENTQTFQRCTTFICLSWIVMMLIFYPLLENIIFTSEKLGKAMNILLWLQTRKDETIELSLTTYSFIETEFSRAIDLDYIMLKAIPIMFVVCASQLQSNWLLNGIFFTFLMCSSYFWKQHKILSTLRSLSSSMSVCATVIIITFVIYCFRRYELMVRNFLFQTLNQDSKAELTDLLEQLPDGIIIASRQNITYMNQEAWKILKCNMALGSNLLEHVYCNDFRNPDKRIEPLEQLIFMMSQVDPRLSSVKKEQFLEVMIKSARDEAILLHLAQGAMEELDTSKQQLLQEKSSTENEVKSKVFYDIRIKSHISGNQKKVIFVFTNANAEKELQRAQIMSDYTQIMYSSLSHELRTPINGIQSSLACMKQFVGPTAQQYFQICETSASFLLSLVNDTLDYAQLQAGKFKMNFEPVLVRDLVSEITQLINVQLRLKENVYLVESVCEDVPNYFESDMQRLKQILINLMRNSTKFTNHGFIQLRVRKAQLAVKVDNQFMYFKDAVQFEIYDTGIGISKKNQANLFKLFGKVLQSNKQINKEGIGLGLYITKQLIVELGGVICVSSVENKFTKFVVSLPTTCHLNPDNDDDETEKFKDFLKIVGAEIVVVNERKLDADDLAEPIFLSTIEADVMDFQVADEEFKLYASTNRQLRQREVYKKLGLGSVVKKTQSGIQITEFMEDEFNGEERELHTSRVQSNMSVTNVNRNDAFKSLATPRRIASDVNTSSSASGASHSLKALAQKSSLKKEIPLQNLNDSLTISEVKGIYCASRRDSIDYRFEQDIEGPEQKTPTIKSIISLRPSMQAFTPINTQTRNSEGITFSNVSQFRRSNFEDQNHLLPTHSSKTLKPFSNVLSFENFNVVIPPGNMLLKSQKSQDKISEREISAESDQSSKEGVSCDCKPVLAVDDNDINLILFRQTIKNKFNLEADGAFNGLQAVEKVQASLECCPYKCIFMDCSMPVMNGYEATRAILKMFEEFYEERIHKKGLKVGDNFPDTNRPVIDVRRIPICALTANNTALELQTCQEAGMSCFLSKPSEPSELRAFILSVFQVGDAQEGEIASGRNSN